MYFLENELVNSCILKFELDAFRIIIFKLWKANCFSKKSQTQKKTLATLSLLLVDQAHQETTLEDSLGTLLTSMCLEIQIARKEKVHSTCLIVI